MPRSGELVGVATSHPGTDGQWERTEGQGVLRSSQGYTLCCCFRPEVQRLAAFGFRGTPCDLLVTSPFYAHHLRSHSVTCDRKSPVKTGSIRNPCSADFPRAMEEKEEPQPGGKQS